ncbi:hypothetical protein PVT67_05000 [Gallaecimonas kandeliae]|uniref:hypothetical protein n=1 Tax=Gallaecimonas kandeliae TaxID=3029055 RepID=UPI00264A2DF6|nr:hypothetical protein [Gallaecimonas kandeliae]WKE66610.1 hypothetical protein PVT67_05000 [Gallaecimonas kandeliae]
MLGALKNHLIRRGTHGGPDFEHCEHFQTRAGPYLIDVLQPSSIMEGTPGKYPARVDLTHFDNNAPETAREWRTGHRFVDLEVALWRYRQPRWYPYQLEPFAFVTASWKIEELKAPLAAPDSRALIDYLRWDYFRYVDDVGGHNWHRRQKAIAFFATREHLSAQDKVDAYYQSLLDGTVDSDHLALVMEDYGDDIEIKTNAQKMHVPKDYDVVRHNGLDWVRFWWSHHGVIPQYIYYCTPLGTQYQLVIQFSLNRMLPDCDQYWLDRAKSDFEKVITGTRVKTLALPR